MRDAADISAAVAVAVSNGEITLSEAAEVAKLLDSYVKAHNAAEPASGKPIEKWTDEEIMMFIADARAREAAPAQPTQRLLVHKKR